MVVLDGHGWLAFYRFVGVWIRFRDKFEVYEFVLEISLRGLIEWMLGFYVLEVWLCR